jgi:hypothetical protein
MYDFSVADAEQNAGCVRYPMLLEQRYDSGGGCWVFDQTRMMQLIGLLCVKSIFVTIFRGCRPGVSYSWHRGVGVTTLNPTISISAEYG